MNVFIIGAGFTKAVFPEAPLNSELLDALAGETSNSVAPKLKKQYKTGDIEIALTKLDVDIAQAGSGESGNLTELRKCIEAELGRFFGISGKLGVASPCQFRVSNNLLTSKPWLTQLIDEAFTPGDVAISLNYDCVLEGVLDLREKWSPNGGYGSPIDLPSGSCSFRKSPVKVLKIHGSSSFQIAAYCDKPNARHVGLYFDEQFFPRSAKNKHYGLANGKIYLIAPSYVKLPTVAISHLMLDAVAASAEAKNLILIGSSLRPEDAFLTMLHTNVLRKQSDKRIIVVDRNAQKICNCIKDYWGVNVASRILPIQNFLEKSVKELVNLISNSNH